METSSDEVTTCVGTEDRGPCDLFHKYMFAITLATKKAEIM